MRTRRGYPCAKSAKMHVRLEHNISHADYDAAKKSWQPAKPVIGAAKFDENPTPTTKEEQ
jgi:hypothetical protein